MGTCVVRGRWRAVGGAVFRVLAVWAVSTLTMLILAGLLPDFRIQSPSGDSPTTIARTAAIGAGAFGLLSALVWPLLVRALLLVPAFFLGVLVFFLNGSMLLLALRLVPDGGSEAGPETAVAVAAIMSAVASATSTALAVRDDGAYRRRLRRLAHRHRPGPRRTGEDGLPARPGILFLQLDGVGFDVLSEAVSPRTLPGTGRVLPPVMETVASWIESGGHRLSMWRTDWSSQTGASQLGILHGTNHDVPAFRWYEKETGRVLVCSSPSSVAELQRRAVERTGDRGLLAEDGASRGNLFSGGAQQLALVLSVAARRGRGIRSRAGYFAYFSDPANATRTALSFTAEVFREIVQAVRARMRGDEPRVKRGGLYPFIRAFATVVSRDVVVAAVIGDLFAGRTVVYADLVAYDEVAHHSGPHSRDAQQVLARLDRSVRLIAKAAAHAPRAYRIVLLSDHGQSPGRTFAEAYGITLEELVRIGCRGGRSGSRPLAGRRADREVTGAEARAVARAALHRVDEEEKETRRGRGAGPVVLGSGNLGLISFPELPGRVSREEIERRHPALLGTLAEHPGIGFVLVRSEEYGPVVLGPHGGEHRLDQRVVIGPDPLAPFGPEAEDAVRRTAAFPHAADIMVNSAYDPTTGRVHAFEAQIGSHGGLGGSQGHAFLLRPAELSPPVPEGEILSGAEAVHRVFRRWLAETEAPGAPLSPPAGGPGERVG
ncbi:phage holin family protein [Streptomyces xinghaiensis]|uniref:phage holin family protein n=1 Tax=Streptomyces xinghaiensis TaxID=1038928 RepID=UPI003990775B